MNTAEYARKFMVKSKSFNLLSLNHVIGCIALGESGKYALASQKSRAISRLTNMGLGAMKPYVEYFTREIGQ